MLVRRQIERDGCCRQGLPPVWDRLQTSGALDFGTLGDADLFHGSATIGIMQTGHLEWFAGYNHLDVGGVRIRGVVGGMRFRF